MKSINVIPFMLSVIVIGAFICILPFAACAQGTTYLSTLGNPNNGGFGPVASDIWIAQIFQTGTASSGYQLVSVQISMNEADPTATGFNVSLYSNSGMHPGSNLGVLSGSANPSSATYTYNASSILLLPATSYWIVLRSAVPYSTGAFYLNDTLSFSVSYTSSDNWLIPDPLYSAYAISYDSASSWGAPGAYIALFAVNATPVPAWMSTSLPTNIWSSVACSADGTKLFACAGGGSPFSGNPSSVYASTNGGSTWTQTGSPSNYWADIASSADGTKLVAVVGTTSKSGGIYTSTDGGLNWLSNNVTAKPWRSVASSADGSKLYGVTFSGQLYATTNSGTSWISNAAPNGAWTIACSADGTKLVAAPGNLGGHICTSTNSGTSWTTNNSIPSRIWWSVASSADGKILAAVDGQGGPSGHVFTSTNSGATWFSNSLPLLSWQEIALSADGTTLIAAAWNSSGNPTGPIYTSTNSGLTWVSNSVPNLIWTGVACSADGNKLVAISAGTNTSSIGKGSVWILQTPSSPILNITSTNGLRVSWLIPSTNLVLQQSADLASWSDATNRPVLNFTNLQNQVTLLPAGNSGFYRLKTQ